MTESRKVHPLLRPIHGAAGKTADWRTIKPVIEYDKCTKCNLCWLNCPDSCFSFDEEQYPVIDYTYCKGCMICMEVCPHDAILEVPETHEEI